MTQIAGIHSSGCGFKQTVYNVAAFQASNAATATVSNNMTRSSSKLVNTLIGKSILETVFVSAIAVGFYINVLPPYFHGWGEASAHSISGWAVNNAAPWERVEVQLFIDGKFIATTPASLPRPDVKAAGWAKDEWHGYTFPVPVLPEGLHEARAYALHQSGGATRYTLQTLGDPILFRVRPGGELVDVSKTELSKR